MVVVRVGMVMVGRHDCDEGGVEGSMVLCNLVEVNSSTKWRRYRSISAHTSSRVRCAGIDLGLLIITVLITIKD